jgi:hypothetical protein
MFKSLIHWEEALNQQSLGVGGQMPFDKTILKLFRFLRGLFTGLSSMVYSAWEHLLVAPIPLLRSTLWPQSHFIAFFSNKPYVHMTLSQALLLGGQVAWLGFLRKRHIYRQSAFFVFFFLCVVLLGLELVATHFLDRCSTTWATYTPGLVIFNIKDFRI